MGAIGIIDAALLLISAKESCGQPQTTEHLIGMEICSVPGVIIIQSNIDTISNNKKSQHYKAIKDYVKVSHWNLSRTNIIDVTLSVACFSSIWCWLYPRYFFLCLLLSLTLQLSRVNSLNIFDNQGNATCI